MNQWYVKQFGTLTGVSVRTLHHYDKIGLLKPSIRLSNGYRLYSEIDLFKLQQILALKYFGLKLAQIKTFLRSNSESVSYLQTQHNLLQAQIDHLKTVVSSLQNIIVEQQNNGSINWHHIITLIERYRIMDNMKKSWAGQVYSDEELRQFAELRQKFTPEFLADYQKRWAKLTAEVESHIQDDPKGPIGKRLGKAWMDLLKEVYGDYPDLMRATENAYKKGEIPNSPFSKEVADWVDVATKFWGFYKI